MPDLSRRSRAPELMDGAEVSAQDFAACVADLARVNTVTLARGPTLAFVREALATLSPGTEPIILDVGFGAGDMLHAVDAMLRHEGRKARLVGIDLNWRSAPVARARAAAGSTIEWHTGDAYAWPDRPDLVISSLVTHHMDDAEIVRFLAWMEETASLGWFVNDLHRHALAWYGFSAMAALARWHPFVRHDGPLSIARSFRRGDWQDLLAQAGIAAAAIRWRFPFRYCVERRRW